MEGGTVDNPAITIRNIKKKDAGNYVCVLNNGAGKARSNSVVLEVFCKSHVRCFISYNVSFIN